MLCAPFAGANLNPIAGLGNGARLPKMRSARCSNKALRSEGCSQNGKNRGYKSPDCERIHRSVYTSQNANLTTDYLQDLNRSAIYAIDEKRGIGEPIPPTKTRSRSRKHVSFSRWRG